MSDERRPGVPRHMYNLLIRGLSPVWLRSPFGASRVRIVAYHDTPDPIVLEQQLKYLVDHFTPIGAEGVLRLCRSGDAAKGSVWVTFDDADPTVIEVALPILERHGVPASLFLCPGVVGTEEPFWWQVLARAQELRVRMHGREIVPGLLSQMKLMSDSQRRAVVRELKSRIESLQEATFSVQQVTVDQLRSWVATGRNLGNHSWDHPLLDRADEREQRRQILSAHEWISDNFHPEHFEFAYPNGNMTAYSKALLHRTGYDLAVLFDHRLSRCADALALSRIRVNATDPINAFAGRVSGVQPALHRLRGRQ